MKRSKVNEALKELEAMGAKYCCYLPPFCHMTPEDWEKAGHEYDCGKRGQRRSAQSDPA